METPNYIQQLRDTIAYYKTHGNNEVENYRPFIDFLGELCREIIIDFGFYYDQTGKMYLGNDKLFKVQYHESTSWNESGFWDLTILGILQPAFIPTKENIEIMKDRIIDVLAINELNKSAL